MIGYLSEDKFDVNLWLTAISIIAWWHFALPVSIILLVLVGLVLIISLLNS
jgi:diacylglycerol kinase